MEEDVRNERINRIADNIFIHILFLAILRLKLILIIVRIKAIKSFPFFFPQKEQIRDEFQTISRATMDFFLKVSFQNQSFVDLLQSFFTKLF